MEPARLRYDEESYAIYIQFIDSKSARTEIIDDLRLVDYSDDGSVVGIEFLEVSAGIDLSGVPAKQRVEEIIRSSGLDLRILV